MNKKFIIFLISLITQPLFFYVNCNNKNGNNKNNEDVNSIISLIDSSYAQTFTKQYLFNKLDTEKWDQAINKIKNNINSKTKNIFLNYFLGELLNINDLILNSINDIEYYKKQGQTGKTVIESSIKFLNTNIQSDLNKILNRLKVYQTKITPESKNDIDCLKILENLANKLLNLINKINFDYQTSCIVGDENESDINIK